MKQKVLLDIDGVLADFFAGFGGHINKFIGTNLDLTQGPNEYSIHEWAQNIPKEDIDNEIPKWIISGGYKDIPIYPGAKEFTYKLMDKYDVLIVTARLGDFRIDFSQELMDIIKNDTQKWFQNHGIPGENLLFEHHKVEFCKNNGIFSIVEDKFATVEKAAQEGLNAILMSRNWNKNDGLKVNHPNIHIANNYDDILTMLEGIYG